MDREILVAGSSNLLACEIQRKQAPRLREFFASVLGGAVPVGVVENAVRSTRQGRLMSVADKDGYLVLLPFQIGPDASGQIGPPVFHPRAAGREALLLRMAATKIIEAGAVALHIALPPDSRIGGLLVSSGLEKGPTMIEMAGPVHLEMPQQDVKWCSYRAKERRRFAEVFYKTLEGSLDFPEMPVCKDSVKLMRAFQQRGVFTNEDFALLGVPVEIAGVLLLVREAMHMEIAYMGLVPAFRGKGLSSALMSRAFSRAQAHDVSDLVATVDTRNIPAIAVYKHFGLSERRAVEVYYRLENKS